MCVVKWESSIIDLWIWDNLFYFYFLHNLVKSRFIFLRAFRNAAMRLTKQVNQQESTFAWAEQ